MKRHFLALIFIAGLLTACASHPGAAAVVDGEVIAMDEVDAAVQTYCLAARTEGAENLPRDRVRRQVVMDAVVQNVVEREAERNNIDLKPSDYRLSFEDREQIRAAFNDEDAKAMITLIEDNMKTFKQAEALLERKAAVKAADDELDSQIQAFLAEQVAAADIEIDARIGLSSDLEDVGGFGQLSVPVGEPAPPAAAAGRTC